MYFTDILLMFFSDIHTNILSGCCVGISCGNKSYVENTLSLYLLVCWLSAVVDTKLQKLEPYLNQYGFSTAILEYKWCCVVDGKLSISSTTKLAFIDFIILPLNWYCCCQSLALSIFTVGGVDVLNKLYFPKIRETRKQTTNFWIYIVHSNIGKTLTLSQEWLKS